MRRLLTIALRNLLRNRWRTVISAALVLIGVMMLVFLQGFINGFMHFLVEDSIQARAGAIQVHRTGFLDAERDPLKLDLPGTAEFAARLRAVPGVRAVAPRIVFEGMLSNGSSSSMYLATAIDPAAEYAVCPKRREQVADGSTPLEAKDVAGVIVGQQLLDSLDGKIGGSLTMTAATARGAQNALDVQIHGLLPSRLMFESKRFATVPLGLARDLLRMDGRATEWAIAVEDLDRLDEVIARLRATLGPDYQVSTWMEMSPGVRDRIQRMRIVMVIIALILAALIATGIFNTMLMSVSERIREIGTMLAVGVRRAQVLALFLLEASMLGLGGACIGAGIGAAIVRGTGVKGFIFHAPGGFTIPVFPAIGLGFVGLTVLGAVLLTIAAAAWPAWKGARMRPVDALRSN